MSLNVPLLRKTMEHIEAHPEEHDQCWWARREDCGTTYCFAGWAVMLGDPSAVPQYAYLPGVGERKSRYEANCLTDGRSIAWTAQCLLGLDGDEARRLFLVCDTVEELRVAVDELIAAAEPVPSVAAPPGVPSTGGDPTCAFPGRSADP